MGQFKEKDFLTFGNREVIDFCNTLISHRSGVDEQLKTITDAKIFFHQFYGIELKRLSRKQLDQLKEFRELLGAYFLSIILDKNKDHQSFQLERWLSQYSVNYQLSNQRPELFCQENPYIGILLTDLYQFQLEYKEERLKKCQNPHCSHLFYDISRSNTRNWCSMNSCGNLSKAKRFYQRAKNFN